MFYPWTGTETAPPEIQRMCDGCKVRPECLAEALDHHEVGIWGGTTEAQRRAMKRHYLRKQCPSCRGPVIQQMGDQQVCACCGLSWYALKSRSRASRSEASDSGAPPSTAQGDAEQDSRESSADVHEPKRHEYGRRTA